MFLAQEQAYNSGFLSNHRRSASGGTDHCLLLKRDKDCGRNLLRLDADIGDRGNFPECPASCGAQFEQRRMRATMAADYPAVPVDCNPQAESVRLDQTGC